MVRANKIPHMNGYTGPREPLPHPPSGPDRCFFIRLGCLGSQSSFPEISFALEAQYKGAITINTKWQESAKETQKIGFLDLPKEIRDLVYVEICGDLKREGFRWQSTAPLAENRPQRSIAEMQKDELPYKDTVQKERPSSLADCAVMRTCKQVHAEFAEVMYSIPFQLHQVRPGINIIPLSPVYASIIRSVLVVRSVFNGGESDAHFRDLLQTATSLSKTFPNAAVLRVGWWLDSRWHCRQYLARRQEAGYEVENVESVERAIKRVKKLSNTPLQVPWNMEFVQIIGVRHGLTEWPNACIEVENIAHPPIVEAIAKSRSKPKKGKSVPKASVC